MVSSRIIKMAGIPTFHLISENSRIFHNIPTGGTRKNHSDGHRQQERFDLERTCLHVQGERSGRAEHQRGENKLHLLFRFLNGFKRGSEGKDSSNRYNGRQRRGPGTSDPGSDVAGCLMAASPLVADLDDVRSQQLVT